MNYIILVVFFLWTKNTYFTLSSHKIVCCWQPMVHLVSYETKYKIIQLNELGLFPFPRCLRRPLPLIAELRRGAWGCGTRFLSGQLRFAPSAHGTVSPTPALLAARTGKCTGENLLCGALPINECTLPPGRRSLPEKPISSFSWQNLIFFFWPVVDILTQVPVFPK